MFDTVSSGSQHMIKGRKGENALTQYLHILYNLSVQKMEA